MKQGIIGLVIALLFAFPVAAGEAPVVFSKTVIIIAPKTPTLVLKEEPNPTSAGNIDQKIAALPPSAPTRKLEVSVRPHQVPLDQGLFTTYPLDQDHGVLTYFPTTEGNALTAEYIQEPLDVLFVRDDGVIAQIIPNIILTSMTDDLTADFPVRALLFIQAGLSEHWGIAPGDRIQHGMFTPKPTILKE